MAYLPPTFLGRFVLGTIILLYILLLVLNLVSFGGLAWVTFVDYNIQFGLWRVCYGATASSSRTCYKWSGGQDIIDTATNTIIFSGKPGYIIFFCWLILFWMICLSIRFRASCGRSWNNLIDLLCFCWTIDYYWYYRSGHSTFRIHVWCCRYSSLPL